MPQKLWNVVQDELGRLQLGISPGCEAALKNLVDAGASNLDKAAAARKLLVQAAPNVIATDDATDAARAEANLRVLVQRMAHDANKKGYPELREDTLAAALGWLCPGFFPFC
ncbi:MAG: hypothetical protein ABSH08_04285 [Tepidisphaeraceae bacterium]|jgi:hypothetical protein